MCVLWFNNYGLKIPFFLVKKKYSKKKFWSWAHKITKISTFIPLHLTYFRKFRKLPNSGKNSGKSIEAELKSTPWHILIWSFFFFRLNFPWKILSSAKYHPKKALIIFFEPEIFRQIKDINVTNYFGGLCIFSLCSGWDYNISYSPCKMCRAKIFGSGNPGEKFPDKFWASLKNV